MGTIVHPPGNNVVEDNWALVEDGIVSNVIVANATFIGTIQANYDFLVDITEGAQTAGPGYSYDDGMDTFAAPPVDNDANFITAVQELVADLVSVFELRALVESENIETDLAQVDAETLPDGAETNLWPTILDYILNNSGA